MPPFTLPPMQQYHLEKILSEKSRKSSQVKHLDSIIFMHKSQPNDEGHYTTELLEAIDQCPKNEVISLMIFLMYGEEGLYTLEISLMKQYCPYDDVLINTIIYKLALHMGHPQIVNQILDDPRYSIINDLGEYVQHCSQKDWERMLSSDRFSVDNKVLEKLFYFNTPEKFLSYIASKKYVVPTAGEVNDLVNKYPSHMWCLEILLFDDRTDFSILESDKKLLLKLAENNELAPIIQKRVKYISDLFEKRRISKEKYELKRKQMMCK